MRSTPVVKTSSGMRLLVCAEVSVMPPRAAGEALDELSSRFGQQDEAALGAREFERAVEHDREDFVEHLPRPEGPKAREQRVHLPEIEMSGRERARLAGLDAQLRVADADAVARLERHLVDLQVVDERATARAEVAHAPRRSVLDQLGVSPRDMRVVQLQLGVRTATDRERPGRHRDGAPAGRVNDNEVQHA